jgi:hypothetical protein
VYQQVRARLETHAQDTWFACPLASVVPRRQGATVRAGQQALQQEADLPMRGSGTDPAVDLQPAGWVLRTQRLPIKQVDGSMTQPTALVGFAALTAPLRDSRAQTPPAPG